MTSPSPPDDRLRSNFRAILGSFADLEEYLILSRNLNDEERAEGYRYILGLHKWVADRYLIAADPDRPRFVKFTDELSQFGLSNPDNAYWAAEINGGREYLVSGDRGTGVDICIELRTGLGRQLDGTHSRTICSLDSSQLVVDPDGRFRVRIGEAVGAEANHLKTRADARVVFVRQTFADWEKEEVGRFGIDTVGPSGPPRMNFEGVAEQLGEVATHLSFRGRINDSQCDEFRNDFSPANTFVPVPPPKSPSAGGIMPGQDCYGGWFELEEGEALIVSVEPPNCLYLGFTLGHPLWFAPIDFENRQSSLNTAQAHLSSDRRYHFVISQADPAIQNWLDPGRYRRGFMMFRCQGLVGAFNRPTVQLVSQDQIHEILPSGQPVVTQQQRYEVIKRRRAAVRRRFFS